MLKISFLEFLIRIIPEAFILIFAVHAFSKNAIRKKYFILSSLLFGVLGYLIRLLPIHFGVHSFLGIMVLIALSVFVNKIETIEAIRTSIISIIIQFICEAINVFFIIYIFKKDMDYIFNEPILKILYGLPSLLLFMIIVVLYYYKLSIRNELNYVSDRKSVK